MEQTLRTLQAVEGQSVEILEQQVVESKKVLKQLQGKKAGRLLQNFLTVLFQVKNQDQDMILDDDDIEALISRLEGLSGGHINVNDELLRKVIIEQGRSIQAVMQVAKNILQGSSSISSSSTTTSTPGVAGSTTAATDMTNIFTIIHEEEDGSDAVATATTGVEHLTGNSSSKER
jgi:hypothetical protein